MFSKKYLYMKGIQLEKKMVTLLIIVAVIVGGLGFFGGDAYASHKAANAMAAGPSLSFRNGGRGSSQRMGGFLGGQVIAKDPTSLTITTKDGSSKIVFVTAATPVMKEVQAQSSDVSIGQNITVIGTTNTDGSVTATSIQVRPADPANPTPKN